MTIMVTTTRVGMGITTMAMIITVTTITPPRTSAAPSQSARR